MVAHAARHRAQAGRPRHLTSAARLANPAASLARCARTAPAAHHRSALSWSDKSDAVHLFVFGTRRSFCAACLPWPSRRSPPSRSPGSTGGSIGNSEKSMSGTRSVPPADVTQPPAAAEPKSCARRTAPVQRRDGRLLKQDRPDVGQGQQGCCERRCMQVRTACNKAKGGYFSGCGIDAAACITRC